MMKNKLMVRLCLTMAVVLSFLSCRQDILHEQETYNNSSAFQLTSKRISLNESKHRTKLVSALEQVENHLKTFSKNDAHGRVINYANGVSIDTDEVTYIENGPNFHTYTFNLTRENALPTDPLENLVLVPMTDGTYKELLISYHVTPQEKQMIMNGENVDTKDRSSVVVLENNMYAPIAANSAQSCVWMEAIVGYTACSENAHFNGEGSGDCKARIKSSPIKDFFLKCTSISEAPIGNEWWAGPGSGGGSGGGGEPCPDCPTDGSTPAPCNGNGVSTQTVDTNTNIGEGGCSGIPTVVTVPTIKNITPCEVLKENEQNQTLGNKRDSLKTLVTKTNPDTHETLIVVTKENGNLIYNTYVKPSSSSGLTSVSGTGTNNDIADMHNHPPGHIPIYSFADIVTLYDSYKFLFPSRKKVFISYLVNFNGTTYALKMNDPAALDALFDGMNIGTATTTTAQKDKAKIKVQDIFKENGQDENPYDQARAEKLFMKVINDPKIGGGNGIHIYRKDTDGWGKLNMNSNEIITKENCPL